MLLIREKVMRRYKEFEIVANATGTHEGEFQSQFTIYKENESGYHLKVAAGYITSSTFRDPETANSQGYQAAEAWIDSSAC